MTDTTTTRTVPRVTHRPTCSEPGFTVERSRALPGVVIARCQECGCVALGGKQ